MVCFPRNSKGFSLVSTLVAAGIMGFLATVFASMFSMQHKEMQALKQKLATGNLNQLILRVLQNSANCSCHLNATINTTAPGPLNINTTSATSHDINLQTFRNGCNFSSASNIIAQAGQEITDGAGLRLNSVRITNVRPTGTTHEYAGTLTIDYDEQGLVRNLLPIMVDLIFTIDSTAGTASARPIKSCAGSDVAVNCGNLGGSFVGGACILPNDPSEVLSLFKTTSHRVMRPTGANSGPLSFTCPNGGKVLQCSMLLYDLGDYSCGTGIIGGDTCSVGPGCGGVPGQSWGLDITCLEPK